MNNHYHNRKGNQLFYGSFWLFIFYLSMIVMPALSNGAENYQFIQKWPELPQPWYFYYPSCVAVDAAGNVYVADTNNHRIQKFDSAGVFLGTWGSSGSGDGQFIRPHSVA